MKPRSFFCCGVLYMWKMLFSVLIMLQLFMNICVWVCRMGTSIKEIFFKLGDNSMLNRNTIAAISTGMTDSGIGIVRISGDDALKIIDRIYRGKEKLSEAESHTIHYGFIQNEAEKIDEVLVSVMRAPRTFTGEDTVEINCHGGVFVVKKILEIVLNNGASLAEPGEFTKRAFLNGKMDLSQAEAVADLIHSKNEYALKNSVSQLRGSVRNKIEGIRKEILYHTAFIENALDDPEHNSLDGYGERLGNVVEEILEKLNQLISSYSNGRIISEGIQTVILGKPNAGKSSFLNILSGRERAIVTDIEGTTRDILEEQIQIQGIHLNVVDTAGIRDTSDMIEKIGVDKAKEYAKSADLIIYMADSSRNLDESDAQIVELIYEKKCVILMNKSDLNKIFGKEDMKSYLHDRFLEIEKRKNCVRNDGAGNDEALNKEEMKISDNDLMEKIVNAVEHIPIVDVSVKLEHGIHEFENVIEKMFLNWNICSDNEIHITNIRQKEALMNARISLEKVSESIQRGMPEDLYSIDLLDAYEMLGKITGDTIGEDLIHEIFSKFCLGK